MPRIIHQIGLSLASDAGDTRPAFQRPFDEPGLRVLSDRYTDFLAGSLFLPADGRVVQVPTGSIGDVRGIYVELYGGGALLALGAAEAPDSLDPEDAGVLSLPSQGNDAAGATVPMHFYLDAKVGSAYLASADAKVLSGAFAIWGFAGAQS